MESSANISVVHQRIASNTAQLYSRGDIGRSFTYNNMWSSYMNNSFSSAEFSAQQKTFNSRNQRLNEAISHKIKKNEAQLPSLKEEKSSINEVSQIPRVLEKLEKVAVEVEVKKEAVEVIKEEVEVKPGRTFIKLSRRRPSTIREA
jgi:hypothetical protein